MVVDGVAQSSSSAEVVANTLRRRILQGDYGDDAPLPTQDKLRGEFRISHPTLREALRILETEGLITVRRGNVGGALVHMPGAGSAAYALGLAMQATKVTTSDLATALLTVEPACVRFCASRDDRLEAVVPQLEALNRDAEALVSTSVEFTRAARRFHEAFPQLCGNSTLQLVANALDALWSAQEEQWVYGMAEEGREPDIESRRLVIRLHDQIIRAIAAGKAEQAERLSRSHLHATQEYMFVRNPDLVIDGHSDAFQFRLRNFPRRT